MADADEYGLAFKTRNAVIKKLHKVVDLYHEIGDLYCVSPLWDRRIWSEDLEEAADVANAACLKARAFGERLEEARKILRHLEGGPSAPEKERRPFPNSD